MNTQEKKLIPQNISENRKIQSITINRTMPFPEETDELVSPQFQIQYCYRNGTTGSISKTFRTFDDALKALQQLITHV